LLSAEKLKGIADSVGAYLPRIALALLVLILAALAIRVFLGLVRRSLRLSRLESTAASLLVACLRVGAWAFAIAAALKVLGLDQVSLGLAVGTALGGAALATGAGGSVADILGGVFLVADPGFSVGRRVNAAGVEGTIREVNLRKTILEDDEGNIHVLPNRSVDGGAYILRPTGSAPGKTGPPA
jgi:small conductance mechanosensitive channel